MTALSLRNNAQHHLLQISPNLKKGDIVGIYTQKGEAVALAEATMSEEEIQDAANRAGLELDTLIAFIVSKQSAHQ